MIKEILKSESYQKLLFMVGIERKIRVCAQGKVAVVALALSQFGLLFLTVILSSFIVANFFSLTSAGQTRRLSGEEIIKRVDDNITASNKVVTARMIIRLRRAVRTVEFKSYIQGTEKAFTEYLAPPRERGTKMLKLGSQLWMYSPWTERTIMISGHMLRQSVMGSDLSYEDMMEDPKLLNSYTAELIGEEKIILGEGFNEGVKGFNEEAKAIKSSKENKVGQEDIVAKGAEVTCWVLELKARREDVAYPRRKIWVDKERYVVLREELYARSGTLLKKIEVFSLKKFGSRWVPHHAVFKDMLKSGEGTEFIIDSIEFDAKIPDYIFTHASLK